jgi:hypothetical protein
MKQGAKLFGLVLLIGALGYLGYRKFVEQPDASASQADGAQAALDDVSRCPNGTMPCPNNCLKRETEGWRSLQVAGHPDTDLWMQFVDSKGHVVAFNQNHIGHVIQPVNGKFTDVGVCPTCRGTTKVCK